MSQKILPLAVLAGALAVSACSQFTRERTQIEPVTPTTVTPSNKDQGTLQIGDAEYRVVRKTFKNLGDQPDRPVWRVEVNNWLFQCDQADELSCMETVSEAQRGEISPVAYVGQQKES